MFETSNASAIRSQIDELARDVTAALSSRPSGDPSVIDIFPPGTGHPEYPMGIQLVAVDAAATRWTIVDGRKRAKCNRLGAWYVAGTAMSEEFVFTRTEAEELCEKLVNGDAVTGE